MTSHSRPSQQSPKGRVHITLLAQTDQGETAAIAEATQDPNLIQLTNKLKTNGGLDRHIQLVSGEFTAPSFNSFHVADIAKIGYLGWFDFEERELVLDRSEAEWALAHPHPDHYSATLIHELVHAAQAHPSIAITRKNAQGKLELHLAEGATDAMAGWIYRLDHSQTPAGLATRDQFYGPYEAVTRALLGHIDSKGSYLNLLNDYSALAYGERETWLRARICHRKRLCQKRRFRKELRRIFARPISAPDYQSWSVRLMQHEQEIADLLAATYAIHRM